MSKQPTLEQRPVNGTPYQRGHYRRRSPDLFERVFGVVLLGAFLASLLLVVAAILGCLWLIMWFAGDIARRLGM